MRKLLFVIFGLVFTFTAQANVLDDCIKTLSAKKELWQDLLFDKDKGVFSELGDTDEITDSIVDSKKNKIYTLIAGGLFSVCPNSLAKIAQLQRGQIDFTHNNKKYAFDFSVDTMLDYLDIRTGILVINKRSYSPNDGIKLSDFPRNTKLFSDECSDWTIADNLDDDAAVNKVGQSVFNEFGGSKNEFFLDFTEGDNRRAFPGLVLMDETWSSKEKIVSYRNLKTGLQKAQAFATALKSSECANQGLAVYLVALDAKMVTDESSGRKGWAIAASVGGGAAAYIGISAGLSYIGLAAGVPALVSGTAATIAAPGAAAALAMGPVGWVIAGVAIATATAIALYPSEIENLQEVVVLDGPYNL